MAMMEHEDISNENLAGHLLVSAPYLDGGGFYHSVIFLSRVEEEFVIGHILNHPAGMNVGEVARHTDIPESLYPVPIFSCFSLPSAVRRTNCASSSIYRRNRPWNTLRIPTPSCAPTWATAPGRPPSCAGS